MENFAGVFIPPDLINHINSQDGIAVLSTFSESGLPYISPIKWVWAMNKDSLLLALDKNEQSYKNMVWQKKIMINFLGKNNLSYSVLGKANTRRAPSVTHPTINILRVDVINLMEKQFEFINIESSAKYSYPNHLSQELNDAIIEEFKELCITL